MLELWVRPTAVDLWVRVALVMLDIACDVAETAASACLLTAAIDGFAVAVLRERRGDCVTGRLRFFSAVAAAAAGADVFLRSLDLEFLERSLESRSTGTPLMIPRAAARASTSFAASFGSTACSSKASMRIRLLRTTCLTKTRDKK